MRSWQIETTCKHGIQTPQQWDNTVSEFGVEEHYGWNANAPSSFQEENQPHSPERGGRSHKVSKQDGMRTWHDTCASSGIVMYDRQASIVRVESGWQCLDKEHAGALWKMMMQPAETWLHNVDLVFFTTDYYCHKDVNIWTHQKNNVLDESETAPIANHQVGDTLIFPGHVDEIWQTLNLWNEVVGCRSWAYYPLYCHQRCKEHRAI